MTRATRKPLTAKIRRARENDLDALIALERAVFSMDILSRRSFRHFIRSRGASVLVADEGGTMAGYVLVLYPPRSKLARLYSIAVTPHRGRRGVGSLLLAAAEDAACRCGRDTMRLEVHERNKRAIARYERSGYRQFGRHRRYYDDDGDALRFDKPLAESRRRQS